MNAALIAPLFLAPLTSLSSSSATRTERPAETEAAPRAARYDFTAARALLAEEAELLAHRARGSRPEALAGPGPIPGSEGGEPLAGPGIFSSHADCAGGDACPGARRMEPSRQPRLLFSERSEAHASWESFGTSPLACAFGLTALGVRAAAATLPSEYVVDDDGGPDVDFLEIRDAVAVAMDGDLITVRSGTYDGFVLEKGVIIVGEGPTRPSVQDLTTIRFVAAGQTVALTWLGFRDLDVLSNQGTVVLDRLYRQTLEIVNSSDVRCHRLEGGSSSSALNSRVELVSCEFDASDGEFADYYYGYPASDGSDALRVSFSRVHVARPDAMGGEGGDGDCGYLAPPVPNLGGALPPGNGGAGIRIESGYVIVAGQTTDTVRGGGGGYMQVLCGSYYGDAGSGVRIAALGTLRESNVDIRKGAPGCCASDIMNQGGTLVQPVQPDPTLELVGDPSPGATLRFIVRGVPGGATRLYFSRTPIVQAVPGTVIERLIPFDNGVDLKNMPASGEVSFEWIVAPTPRRDTPLPEAWLSPTTGPLRGRFPRGTVLFAQASVHTGGTAIRTNSVPVVIR